MRATVAMQQRLRRALSVMSRHAGERWLRIKRYRKLFMAIKSILINEQVSEMAAHYQACVEQQ